MSLLLELALGTSHTKFTNATELSILFDQGGLTTSQITLFKSPQDELMAWEGVVGLLQSPFPFLGLPLHHQELGGCRQQLRPAVFQDRD